MLVSVTYLFHKNIGWLVFINSIMCGNLLECYLRPRIWAGTGCLRDYVALSFFGFWEASSTGRASERNTDFLWISSRLLSISVDAFVQCHSFYFKVCGLHSSRYRDVRLFCFVFDADPSTSIPCSFILFLFFFCVLQLYLWGSPLLGEIFTYVTVF